MAGAEAHPQVEALLASKVKRGLDRSRRLRAAITRGFGFRPRFTGSGLYAGVGASFQLDLPRFQRCVEKTAVGCSSTRAGGRWRPSAGTRASR